MPDPYSLLLEWRRSETSGRGLAKLPKEFYDSTRKYLAETRATFEAELRENPSSRKGELARQTYQRAHQVARDLVEARMTKVLSQAFQASVGGSRDLPNALAEERELFDRLFQELREHRLGVAPFLEPFGPGPGSTSPTAPDPGRAVVPSPEPSTPVPEPVPSRNGSAFVRVLKDARPIAVGGETVEIRKEDIISLPEETARLLVGAGIAERVRGPEWPPVT